MPFNAPDNPLDPTANVTAGVKLFSSLLKRYGDVHQALEAYNGGPGNVDKPSTERYADTVLGKDLGQTVAAVGKVADTATNAVVNIGQTIAQAANKYKGLPYVFGGGRGNIGGIDCSAFVSKMVNDLTGGKVQLTPFTDAMFGQTQAVSQPQAGDLVFYQGYDSDQPGVQFPHVAIYVGNNQVVDASSSHGGVTTHDMNYSGLTPVFRRATGASNYNYPAGGVDPNHADPGEYKTRGIPYDPDPVHLKLRQEGKLPWSTLNEKIPLEDTPKYEPAPEPTFNDNLGSVDPFFTQPQMDMSGFNGSQSTYNPGYFSSNIFSPDFGQSASSGAMAPHDFLNSIFSVLTGEKWDVSQGGYWDKSKALDYEPPQAGDLAFWGAYDPDKLNYAGLVLGANQEGIPLILYPDWGTKGIKMLDPTLDKPFNLQYRRL